MTDAFKDVIALNTNQLNPLLLLLTCGGTTDGRTHHNIERAPISAKAGAI